MEIEVEDSGFGMKDELTKTLFTMFSNLKNKR
jgi:hypothetical protein